MQLRDLTEGRDAPLYHGTPVDLFLSIMAEDTLEGGEPDDEIGYERASVRLTRNYRTAMGFSSMGNGITGAVIEIDQNKLIQHYKVQPFHDQGYAGERSGGKGESEEVVLHDRIRPLSTVMSQFYINPDAVKWVLEPNRLEKFLDSSFFGMNAKEVHELANFVLTHPKRTLI